MRNLYRCKITGGGRLLMSGEYYANRASEARLKLRCEYLDRYKSEGWPIIELCEETSRLLQHGVQS